MSWWTRLFGKGAPSGKKETQAAAPVQIQTPKSGDRKRRLEQTLRDISGKDNAFDMLMWRLANASMDGESEDTVLDFLEQRIAERKAARDRLRGVLKEAMQELNSSPDYFKPSFTNLGRYDKDTPQTDKKQADSAQHPVLRCNNCGAQQRQGDWERAMDVRARAMGSGGFVNLSAPEQCLKCGSTDLADASAPKARREESPKEVQDYAAQLVSAGSKWAAAHAKEQGAVSYSSDRFSCGIVGNKAHQGRDGENDSTGYW